MGRIDRSGGQDATMERRHIHAMIRHIEGYELVKRRLHPEYRTATSFYAGIGVCKQNFLKYYRRYIENDRKIALNQGSNSRAMIFANDKISLPMSHYFTTFDALGTTMDRDHISDAPSIG